MTGVEAQGVEFILRFRDEATTQISTAETAYNSLVSAMQKVLHMEKSFGDAAVESIIKASSAAKRTGGSSIITPLTIDQNKLALVSQFEQIASSWFRDIGILYSRYLGQVKAAAATTGTMRDIVVELSSAAKEGAGGVDSFFKMARRFTSLKFDDKGSFGEMLRNLQDIVKAIMDWVPVNEQASTSLDGLAKSVTNTDAAIKGTEGRLERFLKVVQKAFSRRDMTQAAQGVGQVEGAVSKLGNSAQGASFHMLDVRDGIRKAGQEAGDKTRFFDNMKNSIKGILDKAANLQTVFATLAAGAISGKSVQMFTSLEDSILQAQIQTGKFSTSASELTWKFSKLAAEAGVTQESMAGVVEQVAILRGSIDDTSDSMYKFLAQFSNLTRTPASAVAEFALRWQQITSMSDEGVQTFMKSLFKLRAGSKMTMSEVMSYFDENVEIFRQLALSLNQPLDEVVKNIGSKMLMARQAFKEKFLDPGLFDRAIRGIMTAANDDFRALNQMIGVTGTSVEQLRSMIAQGDMAGVLKVMGDSMRYWNQQGFQGQTVMEAFAQALGATKEEILGMAKLTPDLYDKIAEGQKKLGDANTVYEQSLENLRKSNAQKLQQLGTSWDMFVTNLGGLISIVLKPALDLLNKGLVILSENKGLANVVSVLGGLASLLMSVSLMSWVWKALGLGTGPLAKAIGAVGSALGTVAAKVGLVGAAAEGSAVKVGFLNGAFGTLGRTMGTLSAIWIGWNIGEWLHDNVKAVRDFGEEIGRVLMKASAVRELINWFKTGKWEDPLIPAIKSLEEQLRSRSIKFDRGGLGDLDYFESLIQKLNEAKGGAVPSAAIPPASSPDVTATPSAARSVSETSAQASAPAKSGNEPVFVDPSTGQTTASPSASGEDYVRRMHPEWFDKRPAQTTVDDVKDEKTSVPSKDPEVAELLRENNAHLKWLREYAAMIASSQKASGRSSVFVQGL